MNYRNLARTHLESAKRELDTNNDQRLKYAALELRMAMEALTYDRALAYKDEFPPSEYKTWQPRKLLAVLLDIDPLTDKDCTVAFGLERKYGVPASVMESLGAETVLNMGVLKDHYDAIGNHLHLPSLKQVLEKKTVDLAALRSRCETIATYIDKVLSSPVFNVLFGNLSEMNCVKCGKIIWKRWPDERKQVTAECFECRATYTLTKTPDGQVQCSPNTEEVKCPDAKCGHQGFIWPNELKVGSYWQCVKCNRKYEIVLCLRHKTECN